MGPSYFVLALLGCDDAELACREARVLEARYESAAACIAAINAQLPANSDLAYPVIMGRCQPVGPQMAERHKEPAG